MRSSLAAAALLGCGGRSGSGDDQPLVPGGDGGPDVDVGGGGPDAAAAGQCDDPLAGGVLAGLVPLIDGGSPDFGRTYDSGLDARKMFDLSRVRRDDALTPIELYYLRTSTPDALPPADGWTVRIHGMVQAEVQVSIDDILAHASDRGTFVMECSGNDGGAAFGLMSAGSWRGVPIGKLLDRVTPLAGATRIRISGYDRHDGPSVTSYAGADWIFSRADLDQAGAFAATHLDGQPLPLEHGYPVRLYVPGWYGCVCVKWLNEIELLPDDAPPTFQMLEFARRTMQDGEPKLARDWIPAIIDQAAMPVRVERWTVGGRTRYLVAGILWGGQKPTDKLDVRFGSGDAWRRVDVCPSMTTNATWTIWAYLWDPPGAGSYEITCRIDDPSVRQRRLDSGYYARQVKITEV